MYQSGKYFKMNNFFQYFHEKNMFGSYVKSAIKSDFVSNKSNYEKRSVTINILIISSLSFPSTVKSFYLPPLIFVLDHMCLLLGPLFHLTKADARRKEEE